MAELQNVILIQFIIAVQLSDSVETLRSIASVTPASTTALSTWKARFVLTDGVERNSR